MSDTTPKVAEILEWDFAPWSENVIIPATWTSYDVPPSERGPFFIIGCGDRDTALHVLELLNEEADRVLRTVIDDERS